MSCVRNAVSLQAQQAIRVPRNHFPSKVSLECIFIYWLTSLRLFLITLVVESEVLVGRGERMRGIGVRRVAAIVAVVVLTSHVVVGVCRVRCTIFLGVAVRIGRTRSPLVIGLITKTRVVVIVLRRYHVMRQHRMSIADNFRIATIVALDGMLRAWIM